MSDVDERINVRGDVQKSTRLFTAAANSRIDLPSKPVDSRVMHGSELYGGQRKWVKIVRFGLAVRKSLFGNSLRKDCLPETAILRAIPKRMTTKVALT